MKIIAFEGIDACGKSTQVELLRNYLNQYGYKVIEYSFPRKDTPIGSLIYGYLKGNVKLSTEAAHMLFEVDRIDFISIIEEIESKGYDFLIVDRFTLSNVAYGVAKGLSFNWLCMLQAYVKKPDITFLLDIPPDISFLRRSVRNDSYERDFELLNKARAAYTLLAKQDDSIKLIWADKASHQQVHFSVLEHLRKEKLI